MAYQLSDLITSVRKRAKDLTFDSSLITEYLQEVNNEIVSRYRWPFMEYSDDDSVSLNSTEYQLPKRLDILLVLKLNKANSISNLVPDYMPWHDFNEQFPNPTQATKSSPANYTIFGGVLLWSAPLDANYSLTIRYTRQPVVLSADTSVPDVPEQYKEIMVTGALAKVENYRGNFDVAALMERKVEERTEDMLNRLSLRQLISLPKAKFGRR